jgi:hypothetical protein
MVTIMAQPDSFPCLGFEPAQKRLCFEMWLDCVFVPQV